MFYGNWVYFTAIWYILRPFGIFYDYWYIFFRFGMLYQEKSGNPDRDSGSVAHFLATAVEHSGRVCTKKRMHCPTK
jgi:hypothetical protein